MQYLNLALFLSPVWAPGILGAWFVLSKPDAVSRQELALRLTVGAAALMAIAMAAFLMSPWFQQNNAGSSRDLASVRA